MNDREPKRSSARQYETDQAAAALGECAEDIIAANLALTSDLSAWLAATAASRQRMMTAEASASSALVERVNRGPRERLAAVDEILERLETDSPTVAQRVDRARRLAARADAGLADFASGQFSSITSQLELETALSDVVDALECDVTLHVSTGDTFGLHLMTAYFVCAEALTNVAKHAHARHVTVKVGVGTTQLRVAIIDDGCGGADPHGAGLSGLARRVAAADGSLVVESSRGSGTSVTAVIPL